MTNESQELVLSGGEDMTTNNAMELEAVIRALLAVYEYCYPDSCVEGNRGLPDQGFFAEPVEENNESAVSPLEVCEDVVHIFTDSNYVKLGIAQRMSTRKRRNWRRAKGGKLIENLVRRQYLDRLVSLFSSLERHRVKAHAGNELNERVDKLARGEAEKRIVR